MEGEQFGRFGSASSQSSGSETLSEGDGIDVGLEDNQDFDYNSPHASDFSTLKSEVKEEEENSVADDDDEEEPENKEYEEGDEDEMVKSVKV